jgi:hypothetical protein
MTLVVAAYANRNCNIDYDRDDVVLLKIMLNCRRRFLFLLYIVFSFILTKNSIVYIVVSEVSV